MKKKLMNRALSMMLSAVMILSAPVSSGFAYAQESATEVETVVEAQETEADFSEEVSQVATEVVTEDSSVEVSSEVETVVNTAEETSEDATEATSEEMTETTSEETTEETSEEISLEADSNFEVDPEGRISLKDGVKIGKSMVLPATAKIIPSDVFQGNKDLVSLTFENNAAGGLLEIEKNAFKNCTSLVSLPTTKVTTIGDSAFEGCKNLTTCSIESVTSFGEKAFYGCSKYNGLKKGLPSTEFAAGVTSIGNEAFAGTAIVSVDLSNIAATTSLGSGIFKNTTKLNDVSWSPNVDNIPDATFEGATLLNTITLPEKVKKIGQYAFKDCSNLEMVIIKYAEDDFTIEADAFPLKISKWIVLRSKGDCVDYIDSYCENMYSQGYLFKSVPLDDEQYDITCTEYAGKGKIIIADGQKKAAAGKTVTVYYSGINGNSIIDTSTIIIKKEGGGYITPSSIGGGPSGSIAVTFVMPKANVTLYGSFEKFNPDSISYFVLSMPEADEDRTTGEKGYSFGREKDGKNYLRFRSTGILADAVTISIYNSNKEKIGELSPNLFNWYSDSPHVTVNANGQVMANSTPKWCVIQGQLKADTSRKISFHVRADKLTEYSDLRMNFSIKSGSAKNVVLPSSSDDFDADGNYVVSLPASKVKLNILYIDVEALAVTNGNELATYTDWASNNAKLVAPISSRTLGSNRIAIAKGTTGEYVITASIASNSTNKDIPAQLTRNIIIKVEDKTPRLSASSFKVNYDSTTGAPFELTPVYGTDIYTDEIPSVVAKTIVNGIEKTSTYSGVRIDCEDGIYYLHPTMDSKCAVGQTLTFTNLYIRGNYKNEDGSKGAIFDTPIPSLQIYRLPAGKQLTTKTKVTGKLNLFYQDDRAGKIAVALDAIGEALDTTEDASFLASTADCKVKPANDALTKNFNVTVENDKLVYITRTSSDLSKDINGKIANSGYLYLKYKGLAEPIKVKFTVPYAITAPVYKLTYNNAKASANGKDQVFVTQLYDNKAKAVVDITDDMEVASNSSNFIVSADPDTDMISVHVNGTPLAQRFNITVKDENWENALSYAFTMKTTPMGQLATVRFRNTALKLNKNISGLSDSSELYSVNHTDASVVDIEKAEFAGAIKLADEASKIDITNDGGIITASINDPDIKKGTYKFRVYPVIMYPGTSEIPTNKPVVFNVTVVDADPTATVTTGVAKLSTACPGSEIVTMKYMINNLPTYGAPAVTGQTVAPNVATDAVARNLIDRGLISFDFETPGQIAVKLTGEARDYVGIPAFACRFKVTGMKALDESNNEIDVKPFIITVRGNAAKPVLTVKGTGKLNAIDANSYIEYTSKLTNIVSAIDEVKVYDVAGTTPVESEYFDVIPNASGNYTTFKLKIKDGVTLDAKKVYKYAFGYTLAADTASVVRYTATISYKPTQTFPKVIASETRNSVYMGSSDADRYLTVTVDASALAGAEIVNFKLAEKNGAYYNKALEIKEDEVENLGNGKYSFKLRVKTPSKFVIDKAYNIVVEPVYKGQLKNANGSTFLAGLFVRK